MPLVQVKSCPLVHWHGGKKKETLITHTLSLSNIRCCSSQGVRSLKFTILIDQSMDQLSPEDTMKSMLLVLSARKRMHNDAEFKPQTFKKRSAHAQWYCQKTQADPLRKHADTHPLWGFYSFGPDQLPARITAWAVEGTACVTTLERTAGSDGEAGGEAPEEEAKTPLGGQWATVQVCVEREALARVVGWMPAQLALISSR